MRTFLIILTALLVVLAVAAAFVAGFVVHDVVYGDTGLSAGQRADAQAAGDLQRYIIEDLQAHYYKPVDATRLGNAGVDGMLKSLHDRWTVYMDPTEAQAFERALSGTYSGIGATLEKKGKKLIVTGVIDDSPAKEAGLKAGDQIVTVDGRPTAGDELQATVGRIKGPVGTQVKLGVRRAAAGPVETVTLTRRTLPFPETTTRLLHKGGKAIGYIDLVAFANGVGDDVRKDIDKLRARGAQAFIFDLRYNGGGYLDEAVNVTSDFLEKGVVVSAYGLHYPRRTYKANGDAATGQPLVVLVNGYTASASEITAGALQDHDRATIVGTQTFGKGLVQNTYTMPEGALLKMTVATYFTPDGRNINHKGITPNVKAPDLPKTKTDETLDRAIQSIVDGR